MQTIIVYRSTKRLSIRITERGEIRVSAPYGLSKNRINKFIEEHSEWIEKSLDKISSIAEQKNLFYSQLPFTTKKERDIARENLTKIITPIIEKYSHKMGVKPSQIKIRATKSRWGSCNYSTKSITFSSYLLLLPMDCIEHIVVHEMAHLLVPNHSTNFYRIMDNYFPNWKEIRKKTKNIILGANKSSI